MDTQFERAKAIVRGFVKRSHSSLWEDMIAKENLRGGCVIDALELKCKSKQRGAITELAAQRIRARHRNLWESKRTWEAKKWSDEEIAEIVLIVVQTAAEIGVVRNIHAEEGGPGPNEAGSSLEDPAIES